MDKENLERWVDQVAKEFSLQVNHVGAVAELLAEGATIPFIARYRKERTNSMDEVMIANIRDRIEQLRELDKRREAVISSIEKQGKLTVELMQSIVSAQSLAELEDIYLPFKPKRKTRASVAREKGLEPLAQKIFDQDKFVYLYDSAQAVFVFDYYGALKNKILIAGWSNFKVANKYIFGSKDNKLFRYDIRTYRVEEWLMPSEIYKSKSFNFTSFRLYALKDDSIEIYSFR